MNIPQWTKPAAWGGVAGALVITIVGFNAGWVVTAGTAQDQAEARADQAVVSALTPICVNRFQALTSTARADHIAALQEESSWEQGDYVAEHGWATLAGSDQPNDAIADACSEQILETKAA